MHRSIWSGSWIDYPETFLHVGISAIITFLVHGMVRSRGGSWSRAALLGALVAFAVGIGRELFNLWQSLAMPWMYFSMKDIVWNVVGIVAGLLLVLEPRGGRRPATKGAPPSSRGGTSRRRRRSHLP